MGNGINKYYVMFWGLLLFLTFAADTRTYAQEPFPFKVGNQWDYYIQLYINDQLLSKYHRKIQIVEIKRLPNGKDYYRFSPSFLFFDKRFDRINDSLKIDCLRADSGKVFYYDYKISAEVLYYNTNEYYENEKTIVYNTVCSVYNVRNDDNSGVANFTDLFGVIYYYQKDISPAQYYISLSGCIIDGQKYGEITDVNDIYEEKRLNLLQNYPNPFNPSTSISYSIPRQSNVELKVFDMLGREVSNLVNKEQTAGEYKVQFDGTSLPSGVYIYTIQAGSYRDSKKLMLLK